MEWPTVRSPDDLDYVLAIVKWSGTDIIESLPYDIPLSEHPSIIDMQEAEHAGEEEEEDDDDIEDDEERITIATKYYHVDNSAVIFVVIPRRNKFVSDFYWGFFRQWASLSDLRMSDTQILAKLRAFFQFLHANFNFTTGTLNWSSNCSPFVDESLYDLTIPFYNDENFTLAFRIEATVREYMESFGSRAYWLASPARCPWEDPYEAKYINMVKKMQKESEQCLRKHTGVPHLAECVSAYYLALPPQTSYDYDIDILVELFGWKSKHEEQGYACVDINTNSAQP